MKVVILCGGLGTRLREETEFRPKPMVPIGNYPILWHIMKTYAHYGHNEFVLCLGYKGEVIKDYFRNYHWNTSDVTLKLGEEPRIQWHNTRDHEDWTVTMIDTGQNTQTGGRLKRIERYIEEDNFLMTYGDGLTDQNINDSIEHHLNHSKTVTLTAVEPRGRFGEMDITGSTISAFREKPDTGHARISGGYFVLNKKIFNYIHGDDCVFENGPLSRLAKEGELQAFNHDGFWQCMDTFREHQMLENIWESGGAPWKSW